MPLAVASLQLPHLVCAVHPQGVRGHHCLDYRAVVQQETPSQTREQWQPLGYFWWYDELIAYQPMAQLSQAERWELLNTHPRFTGRCPNCGYQFAEDNPSAVHWDCPNCGCASSGMMNSIE